jgi:inositol hexakisphosphate/diphosphoinositol-pentakisphosphate kinase
MEKKTGSEAMQNLIKLIKVDKKIEVIVFSQNTILNKPIEEWRKVNALICFFSKGFPLHKAEKYAEMQNVYLINNISNQRLLWDRTKIYKLLKKYDIPVADHTFVKRYNNSIHENLSTSNYKELEDQPVVKEFDNHILINNKKIQKPFVEKPFDAENHNIRIYYPMKEGGGSKHLFRKIKNISSMFKKNENKIRRDDNYIYEEFLPNDGFDIKVSC